MRGSWKIGKFAGIGVYVHPTFLILVAWIVFVYWNIGHNLATVGAGLLFTFALFVCVVFHEFGHALTARRYGIGTRDITLLPSAEYPVWSASRKSQGRNFVLR
jgi:Zn-dependent protease